MIVLLKNVEKKYALICPCIPDPPPLKSGKSTGSFFIKGQKVSDQKSKLSWVPDVHFALNLITNNLMNGP